MIVVDASVVVELLLKTPRSERILQRLFEPADALHAPHLLDVEVAQVLRRYERQGELSVRRGAAALRLLEALPLRRHPHTPLLNRVWTLRQNFTAYDAIYVALAEVLDATLVTLDAALVAAPGTHARIELVSDG